MIRLIILTLLLGGTPGKSNEEDKKANPTTIVIKDLKLKLVPIKAGTFVMGSDSLSSTADQKPVHKVTLTKSFWMGCTEVTQAQYNTIMGQGPSRFKGDNNPVERVYWIDAVKFCEKLTARERKAGRLPADQEYRLPTEAEWEYCCRAGSTLNYGFDGTHHILGDYAWYKKNSDGKTHQVAVKKPNAWGLYDMHGNVYEWCSDWFGPYPRGTQADPTGAETGSHRVYRGGSWDTPNGNCGSAFRYGGTPSDRDGDIGFRLVRAQVTQKQEKKMENKDGDRKLVP